MSRENVEIVKKAFDAFARGDTEAILDLSDEEIVIVQPPELPGVPRRHHGREGVLEAFSLWPEQWDDYRVEAMEVVAEAGDHVVVRSRQSGRGKQSGIHVDVEFTFAFTIRDGKVVEWRIFLQESEALAALGLQEPAPGR